MKQSDQKTVPNISLKINLLIHKGERVKIYLKLIKWLLSTGRFIVIFVELIVVGAFILRYKYDTELVDLQDKIKEQIPYIQSLQDSEIELKHLQSQLTTIKQIKNNQAHVEILLKIAQLTPKTIRLTSLNLERAPTTSKMSFIISGRTPSNLELSAFIKALQKDPSFSDVNLSNISFEGQTTFVITGGVQLLSTKST